MGKKYKMSSAQRRLFTLYETDKKNASYNIPLLYKIEGTLDVKKLNQAVNEIIERHEILRTHFLHYKDNFIQEVEDNFHLEIDCCEYKDCDILSEMERFITPFDLKALPLLRMKIVRIENTSEQYLLFDIHHIICDGESMGIFFDELEKIYTGQNLSQMQFQYKNYSAWENRQTFEDQKEYWINEFKDGIPSLELRTDYVRPAWKSSNGRSFEINLDSNLAERIQQFCLEQKITEYMFFMSAFALLLKKYTGQKGIIIGTPVSGRSHPDSQNLIGMFVNTVAIYHTLKDSDTYGEMLKATEEKCLYAYDNQDYQFDELVQELEIQRDNSRNPVFDVMFGLQEGGISAVRLDKAKLVPVRIQGNIAKFDITLMVDSSNGIYTLYWEYSSDLFEEATINRMSGHYNVLLENVMDNLDTEIGEIDYISDAERKILLTGFQKKDEELFSNKLLIEEFNKIVKQYPENTAIEFGSDSVTYRQLDHMSNCIGLKLKNEGIQKKDVVAIWAGASIERIAAVLGVIKTGAAYMPVDVEAPSERIKFMIQNAGVKYVIKDAKLQQEPVINQHIINLETISYEENEVLTERPEFDIPVYIIYTSGSSGEPKGVVVNNRNIVNEVCWHIKEAELDENSIFVQNTAFIFDGSALEIFSALLCGGRLRLVSGDDRKEPVKFLERIKGAHINILPSMFRAVMEYAVTNGMEEELNSFKSLRLVAEKIPEDLIQQYLLTKNNSLSKIWNLYGPTETTITASFYRLNQEMDFKRIPIGNPVTNYGMYILKKNALCGHGVVGEICISGEGVSDGYINNEELTQKVFVENPFNKKEKIYRTGDTGYLNEKNEFVIIGRIDEQVKIRGFRVELQEIEKQLLNIEGVKEAVVVRKQEQNDNFLAGYYMGDVPEETIRKRLAKFLPSYMVPEYFISLEEIPHLRNGKIDKKSLTDREIIKKRSLTRPETEMEKRVCQVLSEVLEVDEVYNEDNFFELGGDSIKAIRIVSKLRNMGYHISVKKIMQLAIPKDIAPELKKVDSKKQINNRKVFGKVPLTPIQKRFFDSSMAVPGHFNQSMILTSQEKIDESALQYTVKMLKSHHDQLRAVFHEKSQYIEEEIKEQQEILFFTIESENKEQELERIGEYLQTKNSLENKSLFQCAAVDSTSFHAVILCIHHLLVDGVSWDILAEDFNNLYENYINGRKITLPEKTLSFQAWSTYMQEYYAKDKNKEELIFWKDISKKTDSATRQRHGLSKTSGDIKEENFCIDREISSNILEKGRSILSISMNEILITLFMRAASKVEKVKNTAVLVESHGRPEISTELLLTRTVGWFTDFYPVYCEDMGEDIIEDLKKVKEYLRFVPNYGIGYDIARQQEIIDNNYLEPIISFNYFGNREVNDNMNQLKFKPADYNIGENIDKQNSFGTPVSINAEIVNNEIQINISYNTGIMEQDEAAALKKEFIEQASALKNELAYKSEKISTPSDYNEKVLSLGEWDSILIKLKENKEELVNIYPLSPMQEGMLFDKVQDEKSMNYVLQTVLKTENEIDIKRMENAVEQLAKRHEILKTHIFSDGISSPRQVIYTNRNIEFRYRDLSGEAAPEKKFRTICNKDRQRGFDLEEDTLIRFQLFRFKNEHFKILITSHHIIMDGWSMPVVVNDLMELYSHGDKLPVSRSKYSDYIKAIRKRDDSCGYWIELLHGLEEKTSIVPLNKVQREDSKVKEKKLSISSENTRKIEELVQKSHITVNTFVEAVWGILLQRYNNTTDVIFGKVVSGRNADIPQIEKMVGLFINTIPVRVRAGGGLKFSELLKNVQRQSIESSEHDHISLMDIQEKLGMGRDIIQSVLAFENYFVDDNAQNPGYEIEDSKEQTNFNIALSVSHSKNLNFNLMYRNDLYSDKEAELILSHLEALISSILHNPEEKVCSLKTINNIESEKIMDYFNRPISSFSTDSIVTRFENIVERFPDLVAVETEKEALTYSELNNRANDLAGDLIKKGIKKDSIVGIMSERSCSMLTGILAILKAGGAYLPIEPKQPAERIKYMVNDANVHVVLVDESGNKRKELFPNAEVIRIDDRKGKTSENQGIKITADSLAYVIYTSGTTGKPKGVQIEHRNVVNLADWLAKKLSLNEQSIVIQNFAFIFDGSVWEIFPSVLSGAKLRIVSDDEKMNPEKMIPLLRDGNLTIIPSMYRELLNYAKKYNALEELHSLKTLLLAGEALPKDLVEEFYATSSRVKKVPVLINAYGPTETTVCCTYYTFDKNKSRTPYVGKPIANTHIYIVNGTQPAGIGMIGEVCAAGNGVARGYLNQPELTEDKFVYFPFAPQERAYRTGDLGRWMPDGNIELLGRIGAQVKIRGFRIELEEIEQTIRKYNGVEDAAVIYDKEGSGQLIGYCVCNKDLDMVKLQDSLYDYLNDYMVPDKIIRIEAIPRTINGKLDTDRLPKAEKENRERKLPESGEEKIVYEAWKETLKSDDFGIDDNFFSIGGNSIKAISVVSCLKKKGYGINVRDILKYRTVRLIAKRLLALQSSGQEKLCPNQDVTEEENKNRDVKKIKYADNFTDKIKKEYEAAELQKFYLENKTEYIQEIIPLEYSRGVNELTRVLKNIVEEQSVLRSSAYKKGEWHICEHAYHPQWNIPVSAVREETWKEEIKRYTGEFTGHFGSDFPLSSIAILQFSSNKYYILFLVHHCIWDKSSSVILQEEIEQKSEHKLPKEKSKDSYSEYITMIKNNELPVKNIAIPDRRNSDNQLHSSKCTRTAMSEEYCKKLEEDPWEVIEEIVKIIVECNHLNTLNGNYGLYIVQDDRNYLEKDMAAVMGNFLDFLPVTIHMKKEESLKDHVELLQKQKALTGVNYIAKSGMNSLNIRNIFFNNLIINFQGHYEMDEKMADEWMKQGKDFEATTEIFIGRCGNSLLISYPVFEMCDSDIEKRLEELYETKL